MEEYQSLRKIIEIENVYQLVHIDVKTNIKSLTEVRMSNDKILWSDFVEVKENSRGIQKQIQKFTFNPNKILYVDIKISPLEEGEIELIDEIKISTIKSDDIDSELKLTKCQIEKIKKDSQSPCCESPLIVFNGCGECGGDNLFNPYAVFDKYKSIYSQLSTLVSNMFGISVQYFKTLPDARSKDYILHEYSLEHVVDKQCVKILIPDNQLPTREIQYGPLMQDYPVEFEIHIVKSEFTSIFGEDSRPAPHDYLYFQEYMNRMYEVESVNEADDFGYTSSYWRVTLTIYEKRKSVLYDDKSLLENTEELIFNAEEKFAEEVSNEIEDIRNDKQLNDNYTLMVGGDYLRSMLSKTLKYNYENIYNRYVTVAKYNYGLKYVASGDVAIRYREHIHFGNADEKMVSFWFRMDSDSDNIDSPVFKAYDDNSNFMIQLKRDKVIVSINGNKHEYYESFRNRNTGRKEMTLFDNGVWYCLLFAMSGNFSNVWVYKLNDENRGGSEQDKYLEELYSCSSNLESIDMNSATIELLGSNVDITNIRIWNKLCEEELHNLILSQFVVQESHNCDLIDNAKEELDINNVYGN